jgi:hypothetical protein
MPLIASFTSISLRGTYSGGWRGIVCSVCACVDALFFLEMLVFVFEFGYLSLELHFILLLGRYLIGLIEVNLLLASIH